MSFINSYKPPVFDDYVPDESFGEPYDLNSDIPVPSVLETQRVQLVPFIPAIHAEIYQTEYAKDAHTIGKYLPFAWPTLRDLLAFLERYVRKDPSSVLFAIIDKTKPPTDARVPAGRIAGVIGWIHGSTENRSLEIGPVIILPEFQRTFVSANAIGLLLQYVLDTPAQGGLGFRRVSWCASPYNAGSVAAAEKMGFVKEGVMRWLWVLPAEKEGRPVAEAEERGAGDGRDSVLLSLCWDDWVSGKRDAVVERMKRV